MLQGKIHQDLFSSPEMRDVWSEQAMVSHWLSIEQALAAAQAGLGLIPQAAADQLARVEAEDIDLDLLAREALLVGRPIVGFVSQLRARVSPEHRPHIHMGTTTQDIIDTATILMMRAGLDLITGCLDSLIGKVEHLSRAHAGTRMIGRTNGQFAKPITLGGKLMLWAVELRRRLSAIRQAAENGLQIQLAGPVGNLDAFDEATGRALKKAVAQRLGLKSQDPPWQNSRDQIGEIILALGQLGGSIEKIAHNINLLSSSEIGELYETPAKGKGGSSAMAHKRNQRCSEFGEALGRLTRQRALQICGSALHEHERSGGAWLCEWVIVPEVFGFGSGALKWMQDLFGCLEVDAAKMAQNLDAAERQIRLRLARQS